MEARPVCGGGLFLFAPASNFGVIPALAGRGPTIMQRSINYSQKEYKNPWRIGLTNKIPATNVGAKA